MGSDEQKISQLKITANAMEKRKCEEKKKKKHQTLGEIKVIQCG